MLVAAAREVGGVQIQNRGTIGGNVANGSPAGDTLPVLAASDATVLLQSAGGSRRVPFSAFYTGYRRSVLRPDELIAALEVPAVRGRQWFRKVGTRAAQAISKVVMAAVAPIADDLPRIAGSVAPTVAAPEHGSALTPAHRLTRPSGSRRGDRRSTTSGRPPSIAGRRANLLAWFQRPRRILPITNSLISAFSNESRRCDARRPDEAPV
jgi:CO/xanthine dehydrogenase FAD-binding subunit